MIDALADALGMPRAAGSPGASDPELIAALKTDEGCGWRPILTRCGRARRRSGDSTYSIARWG